MFVTTLQEERVDPLIRNELAGHAAAGERTAGPRLGITAVYTRTRPETKRSQMEQALAKRAAMEVAEKRLRVTNLPRQQCEASRKVGYAEVT